MFRRIISLLWALLLLSGCGEARSPLPWAGPAGRSAGQERSTAFFAMDTYMTIRTYGAEDGLLDSAVELVGKLESSLSTTREDSEIYALNRDGSAALSEDAGYLLRRALELCGETGGALDISVYPVVRAWGFTTDNYRVPGADELAGLLERVDYRRVQLSPDGTSARLPEGMEIDLGSVTKGYTGDRLCRLLREAGVTSALLDLGGNVQTVGTKPDGSDWRVAIQNPEGDGILGVVAVSDKAVITSGGYERYFADEAGNLWWHIMDPATGCPAQNGLISVTIVGEEGLYCDALSTALFIMGPDKAVAFWRAHRDFEAVLVTGDGQMLITPGLAGGFTAADFLPYATTVLPDD